jgi:hypothetical protein
MASIFIFSQSPKNKKMIHCDLTSVALSEAPTHFGSIPIPRIVTFFTAFQLVDKLCSKVFS